MIFLCPTILSCSLRSFRTQSALLSTAACGAEQEMNKVNIALFFAALMVIGACAEPRKLLATTEGRELVEAEEHQRILAELEEVHQLRERMLQTGRQSYRSYLRHNHVQTVKHCNCLHASMCLHMFECKAHDVEHGLINTLGHHLHMSG